MKLTKEQKGIAVLDTLMDGEGTWVDLARSTSYTRGMVRDGINWIRDFAPNALIVKRRGREYLYKIADTDLEVAQHINERSKSLYKAALRLERMTAIALQRWPSSPILKIMNRHLGRMREDVEDLLP